MGRMSKAELCDDKDKQIAYNRSIAGVAELVYARALGARGAIHGGSSPLPSTKVFI